MDWLSTLDLAAFRFVNQTLANPVLDLVMPFLTGNKFSLPLVVLALAWLLVKGGARGRCFVLVLITALILGDKLAIGPLKRSVARPRPFVSHPETRLLVGRGSERASFPSGHAHNGAAAAVVAFLFWRRSWRFMVPLALGIGVSRACVGVHYPGDILVASGLGVGVGIATTFGLEALWRSAGRRLFPLWWARLPSLRGDPVPPGPEDPALLERQWLRAGYLLLAALFITRLLYLGAGVIELSEDEAYQWLWSKHLALSYYSKPPGIAVAQWLGTHLFGDTELGVRFLSPVLAAVLGVMLLRFLARHTDARTGFLFLLVVVATPLFSVGSVLLTIDPLLVACWTAALLSGWRAITEDSTKHWLLTGLWWGGAFLSKYSSPFLWASFALFFVLWPPARAQLRRPGPWLALLVNLACTLPVILWNQQNGWITATHLGERGGLDSAWRPTLRFFWDFLFTVPPLMNPVFFVAMAWACVAFWRSPRAQTVGGDVGGLPRNPQRLPGEAAHSSSSLSRRADVQSPPAMLLRYLFCLGAPVFLFYFAYTFRARVLPNWVVPGILPLFLFAAVFWHARAKAGAKAPRRFLLAGLALGLPVVVLLHETRLVGKLTGWQLPQRMDPLNRVRGYHRLAPQVAEQRAKLAQSDGQPTFIIADHYGRAGLLSFYLPEAKAAVGTSRPLVTVRATERPQNQLWFWPEYHYDNRRGENAIYVLKTDEQQPVPAHLLTEFGQVTDLGMFDDEPDPKRVWRRFQLFACRDKR